MSEIITISARAAAQMRAMLDERQRLDAHLQTYVEALGAGLDVPPGYRFDVQQMAFVPAPVPPEQAQSVSDM